MAAQEVVASRPSKKNDAAAVLIPKGSHGERSDFDAPTELPHSRTTWKTLTERLLLDILVLLLSLPFIVLAVLAANLNNTPISRYGNNVLDALKLGPTIFPLLFTAIVARLMRKVAGWRVERIAPLGLLEQLMASQSLASSIEAIVTLRVFNSVALLIVFLWTLSPLGGQSSLRLLSVGQVPIITTAPVYYYSSNKTAYLGGSAHYETEPLATSAIFSASLLTQESTQLSPIDSWNNIKIPAPDSLIRARIQSPEVISSSWLEVEPSPYENYSSLVGVPLYNVPATGKANFSIETAFVYTDCNQHKPSITMEKFCAICNSDEYCASPCTFNSIGSYNGSVLASRSFVLSTFSDTYQILNATDTPSFMNLQYINTNSFSVEALPILSIFNCTLHNIRVEANVLCDGTTCSVTRIRPSQKDRRPGFLVPWNTFDAGNYNNGVQGTFFTDMLSLLEGATGVAYEGYTTPTDNYLFGMQPAFAFGRFLDWRNVSDAAFSRRMMRVLNSFWIAAQNPWNIAGDMHANISPADAEAIANGTAYGVKATVATVTHMRPVYQAHRLWIVILLCISAMFFLSALTSLALSPFIVAPDILGRVSSLTRDSPHFAQLAHGGIALGGWERARILKDLRVQIADLNPFQAMGRMAFISAGVDGKGARGVWRLRKGRLYE